ncbi:MAG: glycosyltransferase family 39 protein [Phycisphaerae bacterium]
MTMQARRQTRSAAHTWALVLLSAGIAARLVRYALDFPLWGDEAFVAVDFLFRDYAGFLKPFTYGQIIPLFYSWGTLAVSKLAGTSEFGLRLLPLVASVLSLALFWRFAKAHATRWAAALAVGFLGSAYYPIRHAVEVKPYATDLLTSLVLTMVAWGVWRNPRSAARWCGLVVLATLAPWCSYPAIFVCGAIAVFLAVRWRRADGPAAEPNYRAAPAGLVLGPARIGTVAFSLMFVASFVWMYEVYGHPQAEFGAHLIEIRMWTESFPPIRRFWELPLWLITTHAGNMLAYPNGGKNGGSVVTLICVIAGVVTLWRTNRPLLLLLLGPLPLNFIAAAMERYPYGSTVRVSMYLAPAICLLAGIGLEALLRTFVAPSRVRRSAHIAAAVLGLFAAGSVVIDLVQPYKKEANYVSRQTVRDLAADSNPGDRWIIFNSLRQEIDYAPWIASWKGDGAQFIYYVTRLSRAEVLWAPRAEEITPNQRGRTLLLAFRGANFPVFSQTQFDAYLARLEATLGTPTKNTHVLQVKFEREWQVIDVFSWAGSE